MTHGTAILDGSVWKLRCEPHVSMRLKKLFPSLANQYSELKISNTPEVCRDLGGNVRYCLNIVPPDALQDGARLHRDHETLVDALLSRRAEVPPVYFAQPLREYQQLAAAVADVRHSLLLADDVGLGNTASAIGLLSKAGKLPAVVVTLTHLPRQWQLELAKLLPVSRPTSSRKVLPTT